MATYQLTKSNTAQWLRKHGARARFDVVQRRGGFTVCATVTAPAAPLSIWLDHFSTLSAAEQAIRMLRPKTASTGKPAAENLCDASGDAPAQ